MVIAIAPGPDAAGRPMRVVSHLADGQSQEISIGGYGENKMLTTLTVTRITDRVSFDVDTSQPTIVSATVAPPQATVG